MSFLGDFLGDLVIKTLPSNVGGVGLTPGWGARIPHALQPKKQIVNNRSNTVTQSIET